MKHTFGLEEEVFIVEPTKPSVQSLYYLAKLVWKQPKRYIRHTDSNFSRSKDILQGLMSGVEISTFIHQDTTSLIEDLIERRKELSEVSDGLIVCLGHLLDFEAPTNTCALQFHLGNLEEPERVYKNLIYYLPLLFLMAANSPGVAGHYFGQSWRLLNSYAVGPVKDDWSVRFQDIIFAKRIGTIELRCFDPIWEIERIRTLAEAINAIAELNFEHEVDIGQYNKIREEVAHHGFNNGLEKQFYELSQICDIDINLLKRTPSDIVWDHYIEHGLEDTYSALDHGYKHGQLKISEIKENKKNIAKIATGFATYYIPKLPYDLWKYIQEH